MKLIIVESPAKCKKIESFLGKGYKCVASKGHIRDLDKGLSDILKLKPRRFDWKEGEGTYQKDVSGFIAQEAEEAGFDEFVGYFKHKKA